MRVVIYLLGAVLGIGPVSGRALAQVLSPAGAVSVDSLLWSPGPPWKQVRSRHFVLYVEFGGRPSLSAKGLLDSLEDAWSHDAALLGGSPADVSPITVLVTRRAARFPEMLGPSNRGIWRKGATGGDLIVLVSNDSMRAFTRHEVMHVMSHRLLGTPAAPWISEGVATWADGRCQSTSVLAVARDLLKGDPAFTAGELPARFSQDALYDLGSRMSIYVLAASLVSYVHDRGGTQALRTLWRSGVVSDDSSPLTDTVTAAWRRYVGQAAGNAPGLSMQSLERRGCG